MLASTVSNAGALTSSDARKVDQHHARAARLDHNRPLASAQSNAANTDFPGIGHCRPDHAERFNGDRAVRIDVERGAENGVDLGSRHEGFQIDDFRALDIECLELVGGEGTNRPRSYS